MQSLTINEILFAGSNIEYFRLVREGDRVHNTDDGSRYCLSSIDAILEFVQKHDLTVTQRASHELHKIRDELAETDADYLLDEMDVEDLRRIASTFSEILSAETEGKQVFAVREKRLPVSKLLNDVPALMRDGVFWALPNIAQSDFKEGGKCLALEVPTAAACLLLRGTEAVLRDFYLNLVVNNRVQRLQWGDMVKHLWQEHIPHLQPLLKNLENICVSYRNPTLHPEKIYDLDEAQDLFNLCVEVVNRMTVHMQNKGKPRAV